jgi:hypothetical protein
VCRPICGHISSQRAESRVVPHSHQRVDLRVEIDF